VDPGGLAVVDPEGLGEQLPTSVLSGSTKKLAAAMLFVPTVPLAVGIGAIGVVVLFLN